MNLKHLLSRQTIKNLSRLRTRILYPCHTHPREIATAVSSRVSLSLQSAESTSRYRNPISSFNRLVHSTQQTAPNDPENELDDEETMSEFLSRFVWIMRGKIREVYPDLEKKTMGEMLLVIVGKVVSELEKGGFEQTLAAASAAPSRDLSEDLWRTVWEVSNVVLDDMQKAKRKETMKGFLQSDEVKEMCRFAGAVGIRGDMLRELRFKWAREKMEESEFYRSLERLKEGEARAREEGKSVALNEEGVGDDGFGNEEEAKVVTIPRRHGKIKYKIYGLDLSDSRWAEVADRIHETGEIIWPQEPKPITGKCKTVTDKILSLQEEDDYSLLIDEWVKLLQPSRIDWITLLEQLKQRNPRLYVKISEHLLGEESFQASARDYSKLVDAYNAENRLEDVERILRKMSENGVAPDILTLTTMVHMYSKVGNLERANQAFESLKVQGFQPDPNVYNSMILAYVNAGNPKEGEKLMTEMEKRDFKPTKQVLMALLRSYSQCGDVAAAQRIVTIMQFAGIQPSLESCTLMIEASGKHGDSDQARHNFDHMMRLGFKPDDRCMASMLAAYEKGNLLDKALDLLLQLQKNGFEPGVATYTVLVDWLGKMQLIDEAEQLLDKIAEQGEAPPLNIQVSLCDMYARARSEKKALQALGVVEAKKDQLGQEEFERIIDGLTAGGFAQDAKRLYELMEAQGFRASDRLQMTRQMAQMASQAFGRGRQPIR